MLAILAWAPPPDMPPRAWPLVKILVAENRRAGAPDSDIPWLAAQIDAESAWDTHARSPYADGLAQFTEQTARDAPRWCEGAADLDWHSPVWQVRCMIAYMRLIRDRWAAGARTNYDQWALAQVGYNAGPGWLRRERAEAAHPDCYESVRLACRRPPAACRETAGYVARIRGLVDRYR